MTTQSAAIQTKRCRKRGRNEGEKRKLSGRGRKYRKQTEASTDKSLCLCVKCWQKAANFAVNSLLCRQVEVAPHRQKDAWQTSRVGEGKGGRRGGGASVVWISLYNYLVTRNNGVEPGNMPKTFNEPPPHVGVSWLHTDTHTHVTYTHV